MGQTCYVPLAFDNQFACVCPCSIYGGIIDYRFRPSIHLSKEELIYIKNDESETVLMEDGNLVQIKDIEKFLSQG